MSNMFDGCSSLINIPDINYFKTLKVEIPEKTEIIISKRSTKEEVAKYFKEKLNFSSQIIEDLELDGECLFLLEESDMKDDEALKLKNLVKELKEKSHKTEKPKIKITTHSKEKEVAQFLKEQLKFSEDSIDALGLDGESLFLLEGSEIDYLTELRPEERENLKNFLIQIKNNII